MKAYHELLQTILDRGNDRGDRTGTGTRSCFGLQFRHNLQEGFPLLTTKKLPWKAIVVELLWFLRGDTNIKYLLENGVHIWSPDAYRMYKRRVEASGMNGEIPSMKDFEYGILNNPDFCRAHGDLGPVYGAQWRKWATREYYMTHQPKNVTIDQIKNVIESIKQNPEGRRHIVTAWNPAEVDSMALPPCHCLFQFYVHKGKLSCHLYQRSADVFLGVPFNIASYALLTHIIAHQVGLGVGELIISFGDVHIYSNHLDQVHLQLSRELRPLPLLNLVDRNQSFEEFILDDFVLSFYKPLGAIKGELSVGT